MSDREQIKAAWDEFYENLVATFGGGYQSDDERRIFHHGIRTVCNVMAGGYPSPDECRRVNEYRAVATAALEWFKADKRQVSDLSLEELNKVIALWAAINAAKIDTHSTETP